MKFEAVRIHFLSDVLGLLSSKNFATMEKWRNDFSSLSATKLVETLCPKGPFWHFADFKKGKWSFPSPTPSCNVVPLFALPLGNNKQPSLRLQNPNSETLKKKIN